ncbi:aminotransferase class V-fold PLP-dependent enzyme [Fulvivirga sedimenti]|uniref:Aminotransferase class V-fold PLP-dependent enzyme n=1 Tax=Fulvivirga sedimenti TaxID=2879465 RepID=A0A9X1HKA6_9BACT|nr:aminotransferase class V-fold PLP-dependent enzyme [Fulvivirga sedimenti]MCA6073764.1 aminotransferase class V-fold PLP-dependent enzyme [Fulvivirga sedimenti]
MNRRTILHRLGMTIGALSLPSLSVASPNKNPFADPLADPADEAYWREFAHAHYDVNRDFINLENGYFGVQPRSVIAAYHENADYVNRNSSRFMRQRFYPGNFADSMDAIYEITGANPGELLLTRNATEALNILIQGMDLQKGDQVILQHHDYHSMIETYQMLEKTKGIELVYVDIPLIPENPEQVIQIYMNAITPRTKCILLTHLNHLTGLIIPVADISRKAREKGVAVIVDAAHSFAQVDYKMTDLDADFIAVNLHKWFSNPLGAGLLYIRKEKIPEIRPLYGDASHEPDDILKLGHFGTPAAPVVMTLKASADFNRMVTIPVKEKRLRYLQNYWTSQAAKIDRVEVVTPSDPEQSCAIASFKMDGMDSYDLVRLLDEDFGVFTVIRRLKDQVVVRVTPNLYNGTGDLDVFLDGIRNISSR